MKTESNKSLEITNLPSTDQENMKNIRKTLHALQPEADKENLVGPGRNLPCNSKNKETSEKPIIPPDSNIPPTRKRPHKSTQTTSIHIDLAVADITTNDEPSPQYWKTMAERRRVALEETLNENKELWTKVEHMEIIEVENTTLKEKITILEEKNSTLENMLQQANDLVDLLQEMLDDKEKEEKPLNNDDSLLN